MRIGLKVLIIAAVLIAGGARESRLSSSRALASRRSAPRRPGQRQVDRLDFTPE
jgi:hypothetical protein